MPVIVVGGQAKHVGKTKLVCQILSSFPDRQWTAVKIAGHFHDPIGCELLNRANDFSVWRQIELDDGTDTGRFLQAGASQAFLVPATETALDRAWEAVRASVPESRNIILESTRVPSFVRTDLFLLVLDPSSSEYKESAQQQLGRADAIVWTADHARHTDSIKPTFILQEGGLEQTLRGLIANVIAAR